MHSEWIVGALAFLTIGIVLAATLRHLGLFLKDPESRAAAGNVAGGGKAASTRVQEDAPAGSFHDRKLKQRLDDSSASAHPYDPDLKRRPEPVRQGS